MGEVGLEGLRSEGDVGVFWCYMCLLLQGVFLMFMFMGCCFGLVVECGFDLVEVWVLVQFCYLFFICYYDGVEYVLIFGYGGSMVSFEFQGFVILCCCG